MMKRRHFLSRLGTLGAVGFAHCAAPAHSFALLGASVSAGSLGVYPDTGQDLTLRFQNMIDQAARGGHAIRLPAGRYEISGIILPEGCEIIGDGAQTLLISNQTRPALIGRDRRSVHLANMSIVQTRKSTAFDGKALLELTNIADATIRNCVISGGGQDGLYLERSGGRISGCDISGAARFGVFAVQSSGLMIDANRIHDNGNGGIIVHRWQSGTDNTAIVNNRIYGIGATNGGTGQWGNGINLYQSNGNIVSGNVVHNCAFSAIRANSAKHTTITKNKCGALGETAIYAEFAFEDAKITSNQIDGATNGISVVNFNEGGRGALVADNQIRNMRSEGSYQPMAPGFGIGIAVEADSVVERNFIENCAQFGINVGWGPHLRGCTIRHNTIRQAPIGIAVSTAPGAGRATISGNIISANKAAIVAHHWDKPVSGDLTIAGTTPPANIILSGNQSGSDK